MAPNSIGGRSTRQQRRAAAAEDEVLAVFPEIGWSAIDLQCDKLPGWLVVANDLDLRVDPEIRSMLFAEYPLERVREY